MSKPLLQQDNYKIITLLVIFSGLKFFTFFIFSTALTFASPSLPAKIMAGSLELKKIPKGEQILGLPHQLPEMKAYQGLRKVKIPHPFYLGSTEVTQESWQKVMKYNPSIHRGNKKPVENISWLEAQTFCQKLNEQADRDLLPQGMKFRLPSESEWEFAARAHSSSLFFFGNEESKITDYAWIYLNSNKQTHEVGLLRPNSFGLYDIYGNVREWCQDTYSPWGTSPAKEPESSYQSKERTHRGGSWDSCEECCKSGTRSKASPNSKSKDIGFRIAFGPPL